VSRERRIVSITLDKDLYENLRKLRSSGLNVSRFIENAIRQYLSSTTNPIKPSQSIDLNRYVVIERDTFFNNVCRSLLDTYDQNEIRRLRIGTAYSNAIHLIYHICKQAFSTPQTQAQPQGEPSLESG
jgi:hypothetical protein